MNILMIHAHENPDSFCSALSQLAKRSLTIKGHGMTISDLYAKEFNPVASKKDFTTLSSTNFYKYAREQRHATAQDLFHEQVKEEMDLVEQADVLIFNFPLWWFGMPAILKGWVDKVLAHGFACGGEYGVYGDGRFKGKKAFLCVTTGSSEESYTEEGMHGRTLPDILRNIEEGVLAYIGFDVQPSFVAYGVAKISDKERGKIMDSYQDYLIEVLKG